ncbi:hypothetical protein LTS18_007520, partial [Coniosporium uncinatum]
VRWTGNNNNYYNIGDLGARRFESLLHQLLRSLHLSCVFPLIAHARKSSDKAQKQKSEKYVETRKNVTDTKASAQQPTMKTGTGVPSAQKKLAKLAAMAFSRRTAEA